VPSVAVPDVLIGTVTASSATFERVVVTVIAEPSSKILAEEELKVTVGAVSLSESVMLADVPEPAAEAEPPVTVPILTVVASVPS
tara:strand:- start:86 stop:340 length:255 start_codon:yes stop_codon:yes gene_type:complete